MAEVGSRQVFAPLSPRTPGIPSTCMRGWCIDQAAGRQFQTNLAAFDKYLDMVQGMLESLFRCNWIAGGRRSRKTDGVGARSGTNKIIHMRQSGARQRGGAGLVEAGFDEVLRRSRPAAGWM